MKKTQDVARGILILIIGFVAGIIIAILVVESGIPSNASNDGWLGFLGGLFGSLISGIVAFYVLYVNRKDSEAARKEDYDNLNKSQMENYKNAMEANALNINISRYQVYKGLGDEVINLSAEIIVIAEDYYLHVADNTFQYYLDEIKRAHEICVLLQLKLNNIEEGEKVVDSVSDYARNFIFVKPDYRNREQIKKQSESVMGVVQTFYNNFINKACFW